jgi:tetratricopeptide (TPR) repeat protein
MRWFAAAVLCAFLAATAPAGQAQPAEVARAQALLRQGKAEEAWRLLAPLQKQHAGDPDYDLALAMAATDSGRANLATFALERVVVTRPGDATARLELARAFYALRDYERAERELRFILDSDPPPPVRALVAQYRARMSDLPAGRALAGAWSGFVEAGLGHDSNANVATAQGSIFIPSLGAELILDRDLVQQSDEFAALGAGAEYVHPLSARWTALAGAELRVHSYAELDTVDSRAVDLRAGLRQALDARNSLQYTLAHGDFELDHEGYRRTGAATAEWTRLYGERARLSLSAQGYRIRYRQPEAAASSSDLLAFAGNGGYLLGSPSRSLLLGGLFAGYDNAVSGRADGDRRVFGASGALQRRVGARVEGYASLALLRSDYQRQNADFGVKRRDRQADVALGLSWGLRDGWSLRPQVLFTRNRSNIEVNDYRRTEASLMLRRAWE